MKDMLQVSSLVGKADRQKTFCTQIVTMDQEMEVGHYSLSG